MAAAVNIVHNNVKYTIFTSHIVSCSSDQGTMRSVSLSNGVTLNDLSEDNFAKLLTVALEY